jgi:hypothetical protein
MRYVVALLFLALSTPTSADPITWKADGELTFVVDQMEIWPGMEQGTPWALTVTFDPDSTPTVLHPGCNVYDSGPATFQLGGFSYTRSSGQIFTNAGLPQSGCIGLLPEGEVGLIQFWFNSGGWVSEPGAWALDAAFGPLIAGYYDAVVKDGTLPTVPTFDTIGTFDGLFQLDFDHLQEFGGGPVHFQLVEQPTTVPEPATMTLMGAGLAALIAAKRRRR